MTTQEFSNTFDTLLNSYNSQALFGETSSRQDIVLDEYEKSILLTQAQDIIVKSYFDGTATGTGFDDSARRQIDFSELIKVATPSAYTSSTYQKFDERGLLFSMPSDILFVLNERLKFYTQTSAESPKVLKRLFVVVPINYKEYDRQMSKAFAQPLKKQAWRLFQDGPGTVSGSDTVDIISEIIPTENSDAVPEGETMKKEYIIRYVRRPNPIILTNLNFTDSQESLDIDGHSEVSECELNPIIHMDILNKAVELALATRGRVQPQEQRNRE